MFDERAYDRESGAKPPTVCVKGKSRRIVVVSAKENPVYEQVIYVVRDNAAENGVTAEEVLQQAQSYLVPRREPDWEDAEIAEPQEEDTERVSKVLFALSGVALALSSGLLMYWFFAV